MQRVEFSPAEKDFVIYTLVVHKILNFRAYANLSTGDMRGLFDEAKHKIEGLKEELGEEYLDSMKERIESLWRARASDDGGE